MSDSTHPKMFREHEVTFRVRYSETDAQARVYHAHYISYFEVGRTELCRASGLDYKRMEQEGLFFVVSEVTCRYRGSASYDDVLRLVTRVVETKGARITPRIRPAPRRGSAGRRPKHHRPGQPRGKCAAVAGLAAVG